MRITGVEVPQKEQGLHKCKELPLHGDSEAEEGDRPQTTGHRSLGASSPPALVQSSAWDLFHKSKPHF